MCSFTPDAYICCDDLYDKHIKSYPGNCIRSESEKFLKDNASFIEY